MIGRADIEGSKSNVAMNAWLPQASYPSRNFSDTSSVGMSTEAQGLLASRGSIGRTFMGNNSTETVAQRGFCPYTLHEVSRLAEPLLGHLRCDLANEPPQSNFPSDQVIDVVNGFMKASFID